MAKELVPRGERGLSLDDRFFAPFLRMHQEMDKLMDSVTRRWWGEPMEVSAPVFSPRVDVSETDKEIKVTAELPGLEQKDIDLTLNADSLTIKGEKKEETEEKGKDYYRMERSYGSFSRTIPLPVEIDQEKCEAKFKNGVLTVTLPKSEKAIKEAKKIPIKAA